MARYGAGVMIIPMILISSAAKKEIFISNKKIPITTKQKTKIASANTILNAASICFIFVFN